VRLRRSPQTAQLTSAARLADTAPIRAQSPFIPDDAKIVAGVIAPASPEPIPIVLRPGFEYRMREWRHPETHEVHWLLERRKSAQQGDDDSL
jgi:hypothetical protein